MGAVVHRRIDDQCSVHGGTTGKGKYIEDRDRERVRKT